MSYIKNLLSIFKWGKKDKENPGNIKIQPLVSDLKNWVIQELPPLSWERIVLRSSKYMLQRYKKTLKDFETNEVLPQDVQERVQFLILEMYQKEINFVSPSNNT